MSISSVDDPVPVDGEDRKVGELGIFTIARCPSHLLLDTHIYTEGDREAIIYLDTELRYDERHSDWRHTTGDPGYVTISIDDQETKQSLNCTLPRSAIEHIKKAKEESLFHGSTSSKDAHSSTTTTDGKAGRSEAEGFDSENKDIPVSEPNRAAITRWLQDPHSMIKPWSRGPIGEVANATDSQPTEKESALSPRVVTRLCNDLLVPKALWV